MDVKGKTLLFPEVKTRKDGTKFPKVYASISGSKDKDGKYHSKSIPVIFDRTNYDDDKILGKFKEGNCYTVEILEGWLTTDYYIDRETSKEVRQVALHVSKIRILDEMPVNKPARVNAPAQVEQDGEEF